MKIIYLSFFYCCLFAASLFAQRENHVFIGALTMEGVAPFSYRIEFSDSADIIKGFSITDLQGPDQTKTAIRGQVNPSKKKFSFRETRILHTRSKTNRDSFCFIRADLKLTKRRGAHILKGDFTGYMKDGKTKCGSGEITLLSTGDILEKLMKLGPRADTVIQLMKEMDAAIIASTKDTAVTVPEPPRVEEGMQSGYAKLAPGAVKAIICPGDSAIVEVWDNGQIDGDIITLMHNDTALLDNYRLTARREEFILRLRNGQKERLQLIAINEGAKPPATVRLRCTCGPKHLVIDASSAIGKPVEMILK